MKTSAVRVLLLSAAALLAGCHHHGGEAARPLPAPGATADVWLVQEHEAAPINAAIIAQHTLYPYHFVADGEKLNELGQRDLAVLAAHFRENPGELNVSQGDSDKGLYDRRLHAVTTALASAGVDAGRIRIADGLPGGPGVSSQRLLTIVKEAERPGARRGSDNAANMTGSDNGAAVGAGDSTGAGNYAR